MGTTSSTAPTNDPTASRGTEADQKGGKEPAKERAERDFENSPKEEGE